MAYTLKVKRVVLVYQAGIANVFEVKAFNMSNYGRDAVRLLQSDFRTCEAFARGLGVAGAMVVSVHCNQAGDVKDAQWSEDLDTAPFCDQFRPVVARDGNFLPQHILA